jgi:lysophospholipase L1-like esterase
VFALTPAAVLAAILAGAWLWWRQPEGKQLNQLAWESSFTERGRPVPPQGPREGYWGARIGPKVADPTFGWHEPRLAVPGLLDVDDRGLQRYRTAGAPKRQVLIIGASVAFGAYASTIAATYFAVLGAELERLGTPADLTVVASGAWKALQEGHAVELYGSGADLIVMLNGLNDLTSGATSRTLFGQPVATKDGSPWTTDYHEHDYAQRVADYLEIMRRVGLFGRRSGRPVLVVLQPSLAERAHPTAIEARLLERSLVPHESAEALRRSYQALRDGLSALERDGLIAFLDCSRAFDGDRATTFTDLWHFSDFGHQLLGTAMAARIAPILRRLGAPGQGTSDEG